MGQLNLCVETINPSCGGGGEYIDAYMVKKNGLRRPSGGPPGAAAPRRSARGARSTFTPWLANHQRNTY